MENVIITLVVLSLSGLVYYWLFKNNKKSNKDDLNGFKDIGTKNKTLLQKEFGRGSVKNNVLSIKGSNGKKYTAKLKYGRTGLDINDWYFYDMFDSLIDDLLLMELLFDVFSDSWSNLGDYETEFDVDDSDFISEVEDVTTNDVDLEVDFNIAIENDLGDSTPSSTSELDSDSSSSSSDYDSSSSSSSDYDSGYDSGSSFDSGSDF